MLDVSFEGKAIAHQLIAYVELPFAGRLCSETVIVVAPWKLTQTLLEAHLEDRFLA